MKFFIFLCCIAHLLSEISAKIWRTTPMSSVDQKRYDDEASQVSKFAAMIDFVNNVYNENDNGESFVRRHGPSKRHFSRRFHKPKSAMRRQDKMAATARYHVIQNPEVLLDYKTKHKEDLRKNLQAVNVFSDIKSVASFSTAETKPIYIPSQIEHGPVLHDNAVTTANPKVHNDPAVLIRAHLDDEDQTTDKMAYKPSFPDEDNDDKPNKKAIDVKTNKKENIKAKTNITDHRIPLDTYEYSKNKQTNKTLDKKDKIQIDKNKADTNISNKTGPIKNEHSATKPIYSHEKLNKDSVRPKDKYDDKINRKHDVTKKNSEEDKKQNSLNQNERYIAEKLISNIDNNLNNDNVEQHAMYAQTDRTVNSNKHYNNRKQNRNKYDTKKNVEYYDKTEEKHSLWIKVENENENDEKFDVKENKSDKNYDRWSELDKKWSKNKDKVYNDGSRSKEERKKDRSNDKNSKKENDWDKNDGRLTKKEKTSDRNFDTSKTDNVKMNNDDNWSKKEKNQDKNIDRYSNQKSDWNKNDDTQEKDRNKMVKQRNHQDKSIDKMEYEWNKRHELYDKIANDDNPNDKSDNEFKKRDNEWNKRNDERNKNHDHDDRNRSGNRYSDKHTEAYEDLKHGRYKIVDRDSTDSSLDGDSFPSRE